MTDLRDAAVIDLESLPIQDRPSYPPDPVGVALLVPGRAPRYYAWGHPTGNICSWEEGRARIGEVIDSGRPLLFHNPRFDLDVLEVHLDLPLPDWRRVHDTMVMLYLDDPRARGYGLKPAAHRLLDQAPEERDAVEDWVIEHQPVPNKRLGRARGQSYAGAYVALCPANIAGPYAVGDVKRTRGLALHLWSDLERRGLLPAYEREQELIYGLLDMERSGVRVDLVRLRADEALYTRALASVEAHLAKRLKRTLLNFDSGAELVDALIARGLADPGKLGLTATGKVQANKAALEAGITNARVLALLRYRSQLCTYLRTFMRPWLAVAEQTGGRIFTRWHATRNDDYGTSTGRLSSTPNFQNVPVQVTHHLREHEPDPERAASLPTLWGLKLPPLPQVRAYLVPEEGQVLADRDYSQQELRILAHYEGGKLLAAYQRDPWLDVHAFAQLLINSMLGTSFERKPVKNTGFGIIYGMGVGRLAEAIGTTVEVARRLRDAYLATFPGLKDIYAEMRRRARASEPIHTWGGREYYCEEPKVVNGRLRTFDYKLPNVLVQGSAADCTKEALRRYLRVKPRDHHVLLTVHDEVLLSVPSGELHEGMRLLREAMESVEFDVPMLSEGTWSKRSWLDLKPYDKKGKMLCRSRG